MHSIGFVPPRLTRVLVRLLCFCMLSGQDDDDLDFLTSQDLVPSHLCNYDDNRRTALRSSDAHAADDLVLGFSEDEADSTVRARTTHADHHHESEVPAKRRAVRAQSPPSANALGAGFRGSSVTPTPHPYAAPGSSAVKATAPAHTPEMAAFLMRQHLLQQIQAARLLQQHQQQQHHQQQQQQQQPQLQQEQVQQQQHQQQHPIQAARSGLAAPTQFQPSIHSAAPAPFQNAQSIGCAPSTGCQTPNLSSKAPRAKTPAATVASGSSSDGDNANISPAEQRRRKRSQQLLKNRAAADRSRARKKQEMSLLREKVGKQAEVISMLRYQVSRLDKENQNLRTLLAVNHKQKLLSGGYANGGDASHIITPLTAGGGSGRNVSNNNNNNNSGFLSGRSPLTAPVTLCAVVFVVCLYARPLQYAALASVDVGGLSGGHVLSASASEASVSTNSGDAFTASGSLFGLLYDGVVSWASRAGEARVEAEAANAMDEIAAGKSAVWWMSGTHAVLEVIFAVAVATMAFLSYHIVRLWIQDCKSSDGDEGGEGQFGATTTRGVGANSSLGGAMRRRQPKGVFGV